MDVSRMGIGSGAYGGAFGEVDMAANAATVRRLVARGLNFIDTAPWYGHGLGERVRGGFARSSSRALFSYRACSSRYRVRLSRALQLIQLLLCVCARMHTPGDWCSGCSAPAKCCLRRNKGWEIFGAWVWQLLLCHHRRG